MDTHFTFRHLDPTDALKDHAMVKMEKLDNYLIKPTSVKVTFSMDKSRHHCEIAIVDTGKEYIGSESTQDMYLSIDRVVEKLVSQLKKHKEKVKNHKG